MTDGIIKGTGNSRFLKSVPNAKTLYPTWDDALDALVAGTFPIDLNGFNPSGWEVQGDKLNKATLLTDTLCTALGLATTATPTQAMEKLRQLVNTAQQGVNNGVKVAVVSYNGTGTYGSNNPSSVTFPFVPKVVIWLGVLTISSDTWEDFTDKSDSCAFIPLAILSTDYKQIHGFAYHYSNRIYGKKSSDGKTIYWYYANSESQGIMYQLNSSGNRYYFLGIG